jgi:hypothetical protein
MNPGTTGTNTGQNQFASPNTPQGQSESQWELEQTYGVGVGSMLYDFLQSGGGFNSAITNQAVTEQEAAMQQAIQRGWGNIASNEAETGISPNSSTSALTQGDYYSNAVTQENAMISQEFYNMWNQSMSNETNILGEVAQGAGTWKANQPTLMDQIGQAVGIAGSLVGDAVGIGELGGFGGGSSASNQGTVNAFNTGDWGISGN